MKIYQHQKQKFTEMDYLPEYSQSLISELDIKEKPFSLEADDLVAYVPGSMSLFELDTKLHKEGFFCEYFGAKDYSISRLISENYLAKNNQLILGLDLLHADDSLSKTGGKVIKNVSGYDLAKAYAGSFNSLAIITGAFIRLEKLPPFQARIEVDLSDLYQLFDKSKLIQFLIQLCSDSFDESCNPVIKILNQEIKLEITLHSSSELVELRVHKIRTKLESFFGKLDLKITESGFHKDYDDTEAKTRFHCNTENLIELISNLDLEQKTFIHVKKSFVDIYRHGGESVGIIASSKTNAVIAQSKANAVIASHEVAWQSSLTKVQAFCEILPHTRNNLQKQRELQATNNSYEESLTRKLKLSFDPENILNPGVLINA